MTVWHEFVDTFGLAVVAVLIIVKFVLDGRARRRTVAYIQRAEALLSMSEMHGAITDRNKSRTEQLAADVVQTVKATTEKTARAAQVAAGVAVEKTEDFKTFVINKIDELEKHFGEKFDHLEKLVQRLVDPEGVGR